MESGPRLGRGDRNLGRDNLLGTFCLRLDEDLATSVSSEKHERSLGD